MRQKFLGNLIFLILANLLVKPLWILGIDRYVQNQSGPILYGAYFAVFNFTYLFHIILDAGINNFNNREVSRDASFISTHSSAILNIKLLFSLIYVAFTCGLAYFTAFDKEQLSMLHWLIVNLILLNFVLYFRSNIAALQLFKVDSLLSVSDRLLAILFCAILIFMHPFGASLNIMHFIYAQTLALGITLLVAMGISMSRTKAFEYKWDIAVIKKMLLMSYPFAIIGILMTLYYRLDGVMIEQMLIDGKEQAGIYAASYRLFDASNMIAYLFATLLLPMFSNMIFKKESVEELTKTATYLLFAASALVAILSIFFGDQLMPLLYQQASEEWIIIFQLLMVSFVAVSMTYVYGTLLTAGGHLKLFNILAFLGLILNFGLNLFLIPTYKALGATWATFVTQFFIAILQIIFVMIKYKVRFSLGEISKLSIYTLTTITLTFLCVHYKIKLFASISMISSAAVILFFALKLIPLNSFSRLIKRES